MRIAVLMSTYNGHEFLDKQLKSITEQTVAKDIILYIRDDGSCDDTFDIIKRWERKINIVLYKEKNVGPALSFWNLLMNKDICADYYAFCDQDDIWDRDKLERGINKLNGDIHLYACNCRIIDQKDRIIKTKRVTNELDISMKRLFIAGCTQGCSMMFTGELCKYIRTLKLQCVPMHDIVLMLYARFYGNLFWDATPRFSYREHSQNVVAKNNKSFYKRVKTTLWNWKNSKNNSMSEVAKEILKNISDLSEEELRFLRYVSEYKKHRVWLIKNINNSNIDDSAKRACIVRILLGMY